MENLARREFEADVNKKVREELEIANIPVIKLPSYMNTEVKTSYIGMLNGFTFYRAWYYWICQGDIPLEKAKDIYKNYRELSIRAGGHCGNVDPESQSHNPVYDKQVKDLINELGVSEYLKRLNKGQINVTDDKTLPRYVDTYHIDTQLGLCKLAEIIRINNIHTDMAWACK